MNSLKGILVAKFKRNSKSSKVTFLFDELPSEIEKKLNSKLIFEAFEEGVLLKYVSEENWFCLTTHRLFGVHKNEISIKNEDFVQVMAIPNLGNVFEGISTIQIVTNDDNKFFIEVEENTYAGVLSLLQYFVFRNIPT
ncbi:MAG: hypothetical protein JXR03_21650 [Cyclobacteriaceae bacterium]